jgi:hypothetical protein
LYPERERDAPVIANIFPPEFGLVILAIAALLFVTVGLVAGGIAVAIAGPRANRRLLAPAVVLFTGVVFLDVIVGGFILALLVLASGLAVAELAARRQRTLVLPSIVGGLVFARLEATNPVTLIGAGADSGVDKFGLAILAALGVALLQSQLARPFSSRGAPRDPAGRPG